jgi:diguanylate cyclase (GGDEF)-like protein
MSVRISKNTRVLVVIGLMAVASFTVGGLVYAVTSAQASELALTTAHLSDLRSTAASIDEFVAEEHAALDEYVLTGDISSRVRFDTAAAEDATAFERLRVETAGLPTVAMAAVTLERTVGEWRDGIAKPAIAAVDADDPFGIQAFRTAAIGDQDAVEAAVVTLAGTLATVDDALAARSAEVDTTTTVGVLIAFAFLSVAFGVALVSVRRFGRTLERDAENASVLNRFTEVTSFATDDHAVASANLIALGRLVGPDASVTHILNRSLDRAVPEASTGDAIADVLPLHALARCAGVVRGTVYVNDDLSDGLSVHCPIYPADSGTLACIPLISGEPVGAVHLYWATPGALPIQVRPGISRITEHAALAIGNRRLLAALHGQATTDPRTGLSNSRAFDQRLEEALAGRSNHESLSVLMLDLDHFKLFNHRNGHPAGDEALKAFAGVLKSCMREGDIAARYGGEEFAVFLPGNGRDGALAIAERIRGRTEATLISLSPGITDRITVSIGIASAPDDGTDRITLLRLADEALYRAKRLGRNRIASITDPGVDPPVLAAVGDTLRRAAPVARIGRTRSRRSTAAGHGA